MTKLYTLKSVVLAGMIVLGLCFQAKDSNASELETITLAGGCFWCVEADFEKVDGVKTAVSGFMGGSVENPTYKQVVKGGTGHYEVVQITFDPAIVNRDTILSMFNPSDNLDESTFRVEVPYQDFFPECRENYEDIPCKWGFLVISRPPFTGPTNYIRSEGYELRLPTPKWNGLNFRDNSRNYPNCSMEITSLLVQKISEQKNNQSPRWIASLPKELSGCFSSRIVNSEAQEVQTDEYWVISDNVLVAAISCMPHVSVLNPICKVEMYLRDGSVAIVGGNFPYANIGDFLLRFSQVVTDLSDAIPIPEYQREMKTIFREEYAVTATALEIAQKNVDEIDGKH